MCENYSKLKSKNILIANYKLGIIINVWLFILFGHYLFISSQWYLFCAVLSSKYKNPHQTKSSGHEQQYTN